MSTPGTSDDNATSAPATSSNVDSVMQSANPTSVDDTGNATASTATATATGNEPRLIEGRWVCQKGDAFLEFIDDQWKPVEGERLAEVSAKYMLSVPTSNNDANATRLVDGVWVRPDPQQPHLLIRYVDEAWVAVPEAELAALREKYDALDPYRRVLNGVKLVWNPTVQQWLPDGDVNEDFIAHYQSCYGVAYDYSKLPESEKERKLKEAEAKARAKLERKQAAQAAAANGQQAETGWTEISEDKNTNVYVSGLPTNITEEEFIEFMSKAGVIMKDPRTNKRKFKLYKNPDGTHKGDGICCYVMMESVALACDILDGWDLRGSKVHVERAKFEMRGAFDPSKKKRKLTADQKKRFLESQKKEFEWKPELPRNHRPVSDCTVILKNVFGRDEMLADVTLALDLKTQVQDACTRFGTVKKVVVYENHPEGVVAVTFTVVEESDYCVKLMDRGVFRHREISAELWDGKTKYKVAESEDDKKARDAEWEAFLGHENDDEEDNDDSETPAKKLKSTSPTNDEPIESPNPTGQEEQEATPSRRNMTVHLKELVISLFECATSTTEEDIRAKVRDSFLTIGQSQPAVFLEASHAYLVQNSRLTTPNRAYVLDSIAAVLDAPGVVSRIDEQEALLTINLAIQETLMSKDDELAEAGRNILTVLSKHVKLVNHVLDGLLQKFPPGVSTPPNKYVPQTLGAIALTNARGFVPFLTDILCRTVPLLSHIKPEPLRSIWARALSAFVDALVEYQSAASSNGTTQTHGAGLIHVSEQLQRDYCDQMELILDVVMNWISAKDPKTRADSFECVGSLLLLASNARVLKELKKVVTTFLNMYKKGSLDDQFSMTKGMFFFLVRACSDDNVPVEPYLDDICNCLFVHVTVQNEQIDDTTRSTISPITMRLRNEVCRCFLAASQRFGDKLVYYLLHKMQSVQDSVKLGAIDLIRHLLNASECNMEDKRSLIVMGLKPLLTDDTLSVRVKSSMCQLCVALADHGYVHIDSGGTNVIHFLTTNLVAENDPVFQSKKNPTPPSAAELTQLRNQSAQALCTIANTCDSAQQLLWPQLLELICAENYNTVATDVFKVLRILIQKMEKLGKEVSFDFSAETHPRAAGPHQVLVRLLTCMNIAPLSGTLIARARESVKLLQVLGEAIQPSIGPIISKELPSLLHTLDGTTTPTEALSPNRSSAQRMMSPEPPSPHDVKKAKVERFQASVLGLLKELTSMSASKEWLEALASAQGKQLSLYSNAPHDKAFLATCLGFTLARLTNEKFVKEHIVLAFRTMNHSSAVERRGMASAVGQCARQHTALMLTELENVTKWEHSKRGSSGLLGFIKDAYHRGTDSGAIFLRATVVLSYGFLVTICPTDFLPQRLDQTVLPFLRQYMIESKNDVVVREAHLETIHMIAQAVERLTSDYKLEARYEMLSYVKEYVNQENPEMLSTWVRLLACRASTSLVRLEPPLSDNELWDLASVLSKFVLTICREKPGLKTINDDESSTTMDATVNEYRQAIAQMVVKRPVVETVCQMLKIFSPYFGSTFDYERLRSIEVTVLVLKLYFKNATDYTIGHASDFSPLSMLLARLSPRIVDSLHAVRQSAIHAVWLSFQLSFLHKGQMTNSGHDIDLSDEQTLFDLNTFRETYLAFDGKLDSMKGRAAVAALAKEIECHLPQSQLQTYLSALFKMLNDKQNNVSSAAAQLLSVILHDRGQLLNEEAEIIVATILENLPTVHPVIQTYTDLLNALTFFADHQLHIVVEVLLRQAVPHSNSVADAWKMLVAQHSQFSPADQVLEMAVCTADEGVGHFETVDLSGGCIVKLVNPALVGQMAALAEMIKFGEPDDVIISRTPKLLALLLHNLVAVMEAQYPGAAAVNPVQGATLTNGKPKRKECTIITAELKRVSASPAALVTETLRTLLERLHAENVIEAMNHERAWTHLTQIENYIDAIFVMTNALCEFYPAHMRAWIEASFGGHAHTCEYYRIANAALLSSLITRCPKADSGEFDDALLDAIVAELKQLITDKSLLVRKLTIRAYTAIGKLAKSASNGEAIAQKYARIAFEAGLNGLDDAYDRKDEIASESINALDSVVAVVDVDFVAERLSSLLLKLRPCFEKENAALRAVAFRLYGQLGSIVGEASEFKQSIHENIVSILLHLNDIDSDVSQNCAKVLVQIAPLLNLDSFSILIDDTLFDGKPPSAYSSFLKDVGMILAVSYPDRLNAYALGCSNYYKSQLADIRSNAALFTGYLLEPLSPALRGTLSKELVFTSLVTLLRDPSSKVRLSTIRAISCLHAFS